DPGTWIEPHDVVKERRLGAGVLEKIDEQLGIFHVALRIAFCGRPNVAAIPGQAAERTIRQAGRRQVERALRSLADRDCSADGRGLSLCSPMVKIDDLLDWADGKEVSFFQ